MSAPSADVAPADEPEVPTPGPARAGRRRRPWRFRIGVLVVLALVLTAAGWWTYQYVGTDVVARRAYRQEIAQLRQQWQSDTSGHPPAPAGPSRPLALLRIPAFGAAYEVPILEGTDLSTLQRGVGHYANTAQPGQVGNFVVVGHCATHGHPFGQLLELDRGDVVVVETRSAIYTYAVDVAPRDLTVQKSARWVLDPVPGEPDARPTRALVTLTTCQDLIASPDRAVAIGHLLSTTNKE